MKKQRISPIFPVARLNTRLTQFLSLHAKRELRNAVRNGLRKKIHLIDKQTTITTFARIRQCKKNEYQVSLSVAGAQYLWILCDVAIRMFDISVVKAHSNGLSMSTMALLLERCNAKLKEIISYLNANELQKFTNCLSRFPDLLDHGKKELKELNSELDAKMQLADKLKAEYIYLDRYKELDMQSDYGTLANSACVSGLAFIMLHEYAHFALGHLDDNINKIAKEAQADLTAFNLLYIKAKPSMRFTVVIGVLMALVVSIFINPDSCFHSKEHPAGRERIFAIYDAIPADTDKYSALLVYMFRYWAKREKHERFPVSLDPYDSMALTSIRNWLSRR